MSLKKNDNNIVIWFLYLALYGLLFIKFPLKNSLMGDLDIWFYVWQVNDYYQWIFDRANYTQINYPLEDVYKYTDYVWGLMTLYIPIKQLNLSDIWNFYLLFIIIFSLNAISIKLLLESLGINKHISLFLGLIFNLSNFLISNVENLNLTAIYPSIFAAYFLNKGLKSREILFILLSALFVFYQQCFSIYLYIFQFFLLIYIILINPFQPKKIALWFGLIIILTIPFFIYHNESPSYIFDEPYKSAILLSNEYHSISFFKDFFRVHKGNLIYPVMQDITNPWRYGARSAFFGISSYILFILGITHMLKLKVSNKTVGLFLILFACLFISSGPMNGILNFEFLNPIGWINKLIPKTLLFRHLFRIHIFTILFCFIIVGIYLTNIKKGVIISCIFSLTFIIENFPFKYPVYESTKYLSPPKELLQITTLIPKKSIISFLPSCLLLENENELLSKYNPYKVDGIYSNWENQINYNITNGILPQISDERLETFKLSCNLNDKNFQKLVNKNEADYYILAKEFLNEKDSSVENILKRNCQLIQENSKFALFNCN